MEIIDSLNVSKDELLLSLEGVWEGGTLKLRDEGGDALGQVLHILTLCLD